MKRRQLNIPSFQCSKPQERAILLDKQTLMQSKKYNYCVSFSPTRFLFFFPFLLRGAVAQVAQGMLRAGDHWAPTAAARAHARAAGCCGAAKHCAAKPCGDGQALPVQRRCLMCPFPQPLRSCQCLVFERFLICLPLVAFAECTREGF